MSDQAGIAWCLAGLGSAAALNEKPERAAVGRGRAAAPKDRLPAPATRATYDQAIANARDQLGEETFAAVWAARGTLTVEQAVAEAVGYAQAKVAEADRSAL